MSSQRLAAARSLPCHPPPLASNQDRHQFCWVRTDNRAPPSANTSGAATPWSHPVEVRAAKLDDILAEAGVTAVDLLKIDIEGAEYEVLRSFDGRRDVQLIAGEVHPHLISAPLADFWRLLDEFELDKPAEVPHDTVFSARRRRATRPAR